MMSAVIRNYQLIRGVLGASATGGSVLRSVRRAGDRILIENWYSVMRAVNSCVLRCRLQLLTWQELDRSAFAVSAEVLAKKYGIGR